MGGNEIHRMALQCQVGGVRVYCVEDWKGRVHVVMRGTGGTAIELTLYGILQDSSISDYIALAVVNRVNYYRGSASDPFPPSTLTSSPLIITATSTSQSPLPPYSPIISLSFTLPPSHPTTSVLSLKVPDSLIQQPKPPVAGFPCTYSLGSCTITFL